MVGARRFDRSYFPAALRSAALVRSCQPGPSSWKKSSTSRSMRKETISLAPGIEDAVVVGIGSGGLVVAALNAASAAARLSSGRLVMAGPFNSLECTWWSGGGQTGH